MGRCRLEGTRAGPVGGRSLGEQGGFTAGDFKSLLGKWLTGRCYGQGRGGLASGKE